MASKKIRIKLWAYEHSLEQRTHKRLIDVQNPTRATFDAMEKLDLPAGVEIEIKL